MEKTKLNHQDINPKADLLNRLKMARARRADLAHKIHELSQQLEKSKAILPELDKEIDELQKRYENTPVTIVVTEHAVIQCISRSGLVDTDAIRQQLHDDVSRLMPDTFIGAKCKLPIGNGMQAVVASNGYVVTVIKTGE